MRDQRVTVYRPTETLVDGVPQKNYVLNDTWWGRIEPPDASEVTTGQSAGHRVDGVLNLHAEAVIGVNDVVLDADDVVWEVRAVLPRRTTNEQQAYLERQDDAQGTYTLAAS